MTSVGQKIVKSAGWAVAGDVAVLLSGGAASIIAARLLPKSEIGLVGIVTLLLVLLETLTASGVEQALVQRDSPSDDLLHAGWTWQVLRGFALGLLLLCGAPLLASFYDEPALLPIASTLALQPVLRGATNIRLVLSIRELDFRVLFVLTATPALLRLAAVVALSLWLRNAYALVAANLLEHGARLALSFVLISRRPALRWNRAEIGSLLRFGRWLTAVSILTYINTRGDDVFVSKRFGPADLAVYQLAYTLANVPVTGISHVVGRVTFAAYARLQHDRERLRAAFHEAFRIVTLAAFVAASALFFAFPFLPVVVGPQWTEAIAVGKVLALGGALRALLNTASPLFQGTGRPDLDLRMNLPRLVTLVVLLPPLAGAAGLYGVGLASLASVCACLPVWLYGVRVQTGLGAPTLARLCLGAALPGAMAAGVFGSLAAFLPRTAAGLSAFALCGAAATYLALRACERVTGLVLLPKLERLKAL